MHNPSFLLFSLLLLHYSHTYVVCTDLICFHSDTINIIYLFILCHQYGHYNVHIKLRLTYLSSTAISVISCPLCYLSSTFTLVYFGCFFTFCCLFILYTCMQLFAMFLDFCFFFGYWLFAYLLCDVFSNIYHFNFYVFYLY